MRFFSIRDVKELFGYREVFMLLGLMIAATIMCILENGLPQYIMPGMALSILAGLLYGPYACVALNIINLIFNLLNGCSLGYCVIDSLTVLFLTYIPYRLWYSIGMEQDNRPPVLDSVRNVVKFVAIVVISSAIYAVMYNIEDSVIKGEHMVDVMDVATFFNAMSFSLMLGMAVILMLRYLGIMFYIPKRGGTPDGYRRTIDSRWYYICLLFGIVAPPSFLYGKDAMTIDMTAACMYILMLMFVMVPIEHSVTYEKTKERWGFKFNTFNGNLIERMIAMFLIYGVFVCVITTLAARFEILTPIFDMDEDRSVTFYMSLILTGFFIPAIVFLWYMERNVTKPIEVMSTASKNFIDDEYGDAGTEFKRKCEPFVKIDTEIGELASSLIKMTDDIGDYIGDIKSLNSFQEKYRAELNVAQNIQESFVPMNFDSMDGSGVSIAGSMDAARYVGGDFYDFFMIDTDHVGLAIGDVSGKGVPAALFMAVTKSLLESHAHPGLEPSEIMAKVNINLCRNNDENMFVTSWFGILELSTGKLRFTSAGHNPPILVRSGSEPELLNCAPALVLGAREGIKYQTYEMDMSIGDRILLYTDGVTEANDDFHGFYGMERLMSLMAKCSNMAPADEISTIKRDISEFTKGAEQFDDITMLLFRYEGKGQPKSNCNVETDV